jgi:hypothetical protein
VQHPRTSQGESSAPAARSACPWAILEARRGAGWPDRGYR